MLRTAIIFFLASFCSATVMNASPNLISTVSEVTVTWSGISEVHKDDWIGTFTSTSPYAMSWLWANASSTYSQGFGQLSFQLINIRQTMIIKYLRNDQDYTVVAESNLIQTEEMLPLQIHISLTGDHSEMRIMWVSGSSGIPIVQYGTDATSLNLTATGTSSTYNLSDMCGASNYTWFPPGMISDVLLTSLVPSTQYFYRVGNPKDGFSEVYSFTSSKNLGDDTVNIIAYGDMGTILCLPDAAWCAPASNGTTSWIAKELSSTSYDMILHIGDIAYAVGWSLMWEGFFAQIQPISSEIPYMVCIGNHEYDYEDQPFKPSWSNYGDDSHGECGIPYSKRFHMPGNELWYSYSYGSVHIVMLSTEHDMLPGSDQYNWLENDLQSVDRSVTPWVIVGGHRPLYSSGNYTGDYIMSINLRKALEDLLYSNNVDLCIWGHYHSYERTCKVYNAQCVEDGPVHMVIGNAGKNLDGLWMEPQPEWSIVRGIFWGYTRIKINNNTLTVEVVSDQGDILQDKLVLTH